MNEDSNKRIISNLILSVVSGRMRVLDALKKFPKERDDETVKCCWYALMHYEADEDIRRRDADFRREQDDFLLMLSELLAKGENLPQNIIDSYAKYHGDTPMPYGISFKEKVKSLFKFLNI